MRNMAARPHLSIHSPPPPGIKVGSPPPGRGKGCHNRGWFQDMIGVARDNPNKWIEAGPLYRRPTHIYTHGKEPGWEVTSRKIGEGTYSVWMRYTPRGK